MLHQFQLSSIALINLTLCLLYVLLLALEPRGQLIQSAQEIILRELIILKFVIELQETIALFPAEHCLPKLDHLIDLVVLQVQSFQEELLHICSPFEYFLLLLLLLSVVLIDLIVSILLLNHSLKILSEGNNLLVSARVGQLHLGLPLCHSSWSHYCTLLFLSVFIQLLTILNRKLKDYGHHVLCFLLIESLLHFTVHKLYHLLPL